MLSRHTEDKAFGTNRGEGRKTYHTDIYIYMKEKLGMEAGNCITNKHISLIPHNKRLISSWHRINQSNCNV